MGEKLLTMNLSFIRTREVVSADIEQQKIPFRRRTEIHPAAAVFPPSGFSSVNRFEDGCLRGVCVCVCVLGRVSWLIVRFFDVEVIGFQIFFLNKRMFSKVVQRDGK